MNHSQWSYSRDAFLSGPCLHGAEAVLLVKITHEAPRITTYDESTSNEALQDNIDALDEARDVVLARSAQYH
jgi:hypothetical protein